MQQLWVVALAAALASACTHKVDVGAITVRNQAAAGAANADQRRAVAEETCEAQYERGRQNYLAAVETIIESKGAPNASGAPMDAFRAEINAAYNTVVMRCKTHMHCLEAKNYDEAACYMAASDRKDAERRFSDLAEDLRRIEKDRQKTRTGGRPSVTVTNNNNLEQNNPQTQTQTNDAQTGPRIEDQDVLVLCGDARNLLNSRCRKACAQGCGN